MLTSHCVINGVGIATRIFHAQVLTDIYCDFENQLSIFCMKWKAAATRYILISETALIIYKNH